jgi:hypothetical protein
MPSKTILRPWEYLRDNRAIVDETKLGVEVIYSWDPFIEKILIHNIKSYFKKNRGLSFNILVGGQITLDWVEDNFNSISLFGGDESFLILNSDDINEKVQERILELTDNINNRSIIFFCLKKELPLVANKSVNKLIFDTPKFWDNRKLLDFIASEMRVNITADILNVIYDVVDSTPAAFVMALNILRLNFANNNSINKELLLKLLTAAKVDNFVAADYLNEKDWSGFYSYLLSANLDAISAAKSFGFLVNHLLKLQDPSYVAKKNKPSRYDLRIEQISNAWSEAEINSVIEKIGKLAYCARVSNTKLNEQLRSELISTYYHDSLV